MGEVVNLRRLRKGKQRKEAEAKADANRIAFGRTRTERDLSTAEKALAERKLDGHRRDGQSPDDE
jgi:hypothetical protein